MRKDTYANRSLNIQKRAKYHHGQDGVMMKPRADGIGAGAHL